MGENIKVEKRDRAMAFEAYYGYEPVAECNMPAKEWIAIGDQHWQHGDGWDELKRIAAALAQARAEGMVAGLKRQKEVLMHAWEIRCESYDPWPDNNPDNDEPHDEAARHVFDVLADALDEEIAAASSAEGEGT